MIIRHKSYIYTPWLYIHDKVLCVSYTGHKIDTLRLIRYYLLHWIVGFDCLLVIERFDCFVYWLLNRGWRVKQVSDINILMKLINLILTCRVLKFCKNVNFNSSWWDFGQETTKIKLKGLWDGQCKAKNIREYCSWMSKPLWSHVTREGVNGLRKKWQKVT